MPTLRTILLGAGVLLAPWAHAGDGDEFSVAVRTLRNAISEGNYVAVTKAFDQAVEVRTRYDDKTCKPLVSAVVGGFNHKDESIAIVCVRGLGKLKIAGSARHLAPLLTVPKRPKRWNLRLAAIQTAGELHDKVLLPKLERLLNHDQTPFASAAAKALALHVAWKKADRIELVRRLANILGRLEKKKPKTVTARVHLSVVKERLVETLRKLSGKGSYTKAETFRRWAREQEKALNPT